MNSFANLLESNQIIPTNMPKEICSSEAYNHDINIFICIIWAMTVNSGKTYMLWIFIVGIRCLFNTRTLREIRFLFSNAHMHVTQYLILNRLNSRLCYRMWSGRISFCQFHWIDYFRFSAPLAGLFSVDCMRIWRNHLLFNIQLARRIILKDESSHKHIC